MTRPAAPVGWTPSLPRCCPREEFWSFSCSHCNICADFFLIFTVQHLHFMEDFLHWKNATKKLTNQNCTLGVDRSSRERESWALFALAWPATPTDQGAADKVELYFYLHFISLYLYLYLPKLSTPFDWWEGGLICFHPRTPKTLDTLFCFEMLLHCQDCVSPFRRYH